jgi:hypothetical protein
MNIPLFIVLFADNEIYYGKKTYSDCGWKEIPDKPIKKIFFRMPTGDYIIMAEYDKYYQYLEATQIISGENAGKAQLEYVHILGQRKDKVIEYKIKIITGDVQVHFFEETSEYIQKLNPIGWKR